MLEYFEWGDLIKNSRGKITSKDVSSFGAVSHCLLMWMRDNNRDEIEFDDAYVLKMINRKDRPNA